MLGGKVVELKVEDIEIEEFSEAVRVRKLPEGKMYMKLEKPLKEVEVTPVELKDGTVLYYASVPLKIRDGESVVWRVKIATKKPGREKATPSANFLALQKLSHEKYSEVVVTYRQRGSIEWVELVVL